MTTGVEVVVNYVGLYIMGETVTCNIEKNYIYTIHHDQPGNL